MTKEFIDLPISTTDAVLTVPLVADLPTEGVTTGSILYVEDDDTLYTFNGSSWDAVAGGGSGAVDSVNGQTGVVVIGAVPTGGTAGQVLAKIDNANFNTQWVAQSATPTGTAGRLALFDGSGDLGDLPEFAYNSAIFNGENFTHTVVPTDAGDYQTLHSHYAALNPTVADADQNWNMHFYEFSAGDDNSGNQVGDAANGSMFGMSMSVRSIQTSNVGNMQPFGGYITMGNGTDPMTGRNLTGYLFQASLQPGGVDVENIIGTDIGFNCQTASNINQQAIGVSIHGGMDSVNQFFGVVQGVNFAGGVSDLTGYQLAHNFTDVSNGVASYTDVNQQASGTIGQNYFSANFAPNISDIAGSFFGLSVSPTVGACANADGIYVNMGSVTASGTVRAAYFNGDVQIDGALAFSGALTIGQLNSFSSANVVDGGGNPTTQNSLITQLTATGTVANCDTLGVNTACLMNLDATFQGTSGGFGIGLASLALPNIITMAAGCSLDNLTACAYVNVFDAANTGGTIDRLIGARSFNVSQGGTQTITRSYNFFADYSGGDIATDSWGLYDSGAKYNWMSNSLKIGGTGGSTDIVTNSSIGLELHDRALRLAVMDTTARNALTAVEGMVIFNIDTAALEYYDGSAWI